MVRAIWKGSLSFGLVNVPVKLVTAVRSKDVRFRMLHAADGAPLETKRFCTADGQEVPYENVAKGYEVAPDEFVLVRPEELESLDPERSENIEIQDFVDLKEVDPLYFEKPYYLVPDKGSAKAYRLLVDAMRASGRAAIARVVMRGKEHLVAVRPLGEALTMTTLRYHDEVVDAAEIGVETAAEPSERELAMAQQLIDALTTDWHPDEYEDEYRQRVLALIEAKAEGREVVTPPRKEPARPKDLADALQASLEAARSKRRAHGEGAEA